MKPRDILIALVQLFLQPWLQLLAESKDHPGFVGRESCVQCHEAQVHEWKGSHHDLAMEPANKRTVLGDFKQKIFTHQGHSTTFLTENGKFFVRAAGPDGKEGRFEVTHTFGVDPLQQYLLKLPRGHYQILNIAWDTRPKEQGGQRWFHLHPDEDIDHNHPLHWTKKVYSWNYMCAECHSTDLKKNYNLEKDSYRTSFAEIDVSCEACHGPGKAHLEWATKKDSSDSTFGLPFSLSDTREARWEFSKGSSTAKRVPPRQSNPQAEACGQCHSRRSLLTEAYQHGSPLLDTHRVSLLVEGLYHADGQIDDEVYVYGSFLQSKMYAAGVTCTDCHNPHSLKLKAEGNALCAQCHSPSTYDSSKHHFHEENTEGAKCVSCHMPSSIYMVVDPRRDHSFRIPRPDLTTRTASPNACNGCHSKKTPSWAASAIEKWYKHKPDYHYGVAIQKGRLGAPGNIHELSRVIQNSGTPAIVSATAIQLAANRPSQLTFELIQQAMENKSALIRLAAASTLDSFPVQARIALGKPLLHDPIRAVRIEAGRALAPFLDSDLTNKEKEALERAIKEYRAAQMANADHSSAHVNLGLLLLSQGKYKEAEAAYKQALKIDPLIVQGYVNLSDLYRGIRRDEAGESLLREGLKRVPESAEIMHALALVLVRQKKTEEATKLLEDAARIRPANGHFQYVYAVALNSSGKAAEAIQHLKSVLHDHPYNQEILSLLITLSRDQGEIEEAKKYAERLLETDPKNPQLRALHQQLSSLKRIK